MMMKFSREQLYKEIWEISARQVAIKYGLNYPTLLKKCKENSIPLPGGKYWFNKRSDLDTQSLITPLPNSNVQEIEVEKQTIRIKKEKVISKKEVKENILESNIETEHAEFLIDEGVIHDSLSFLELDKINTIISVLSSFEINDNKKLHKAVSGYKNSVVNWKKRVKASERNYYDSRYQTNDLRQPKFINEISDEQLPRLYRILDMLYSVFERTGEYVTDDLCIRFDKDNVSFEMIEGKDKVNHELTREEAKQLVDYNDKIKRNSYASKPNIRKYDYIPNGNLRIKLSNGKFVKDTKANKLEELVPEIIILFYQCYFEDRTRREEREKAQRIRDEEKRKAKILQDRIEHEKNKTRELLNTIKDYRLASEIREFVNTLKDNQEINDETIEWMLQKADWIDPIISYEDELLGKRKHHLSDEEKEQLLNEKKHSWY